MTLQPKNPLHGITLQHILETLHTEYGWEELGRRIKIKCFADKPSVTSSLTFLRQTPWAREKVERLFLQGQSKRLRAARGQKVL